MIKHLFLASALLAAGVASVHAQTPAPKAPAKPAAEGRTLSLGGSATPSGRMMDRDELRACLKQQDSLSARRIEVDQARAPLDQEKSALATDQQALVAERERVDGLRRSAADLNARYKAYSDKVAAWNERATELNDKAGPTADRERRTLDSDREKLQQEQKALEAERARLGETAQQTVNEFNARAQALDQRVADWNRRNAELTERANAVNRDRDQWLETCANRRYREDDEIAIRQGK